MALLGDGVLAVTEGVPQLDGAVTRTRDDLSVVGGEGNGENVVGVADESSGGGAGSELPQTESLVPRSRQGISTVRRDNLTNQLQSASRTLFVILPTEFEWTYTVGHNVRVAVERSLGVAVLGLVAGEVPDDQGLVSAGGQEHVGAVSR